MTDIPATLEQLRSALAGVFGFDDPAGWSDDDLLAVMGALESIGRVVDGQRAACAGEVDERSGFEFGGERLSARMGCRSASELVERVTQVSGAEARRRIALGERTRRRTGFTGESLEPEFPTFLTIPAYTRFL